MNANLLPEYPVTVGQRELYVFYGTGPSSYNSTTGDILYLPTGMYLDYVAPSMSVSKTYNVRAYPSATGTTRATWVLKWYVISTGAEAGAVDLSAEKVQFLGIGGSF